MSPVPARPLAPLLLLCVGLSVASTAPAKAQRATQVAVEASIIVTFERAEKELGLPLLGSAWGKSQPKPGQHLDERTDEYVSLLLRLNDIEVFRKALGGKPFRSWRILFKRMGLPDDYCIQEEPEVIAVHDRAGAGLVIGRAMAECTFAPR